MVHLADNNSNYNKYGNYKHAIKTSSEQVIYCY